MFPPTIITNKDTLGLRRRYHSGDSVGQEKAEVELL